MVFHTPFFISILGSIWAEFAKDFSLKVGFEGKYLTTLKILDFFLKIPKLLIKRQSVLEVLFNAKITCFRSCRARAAKASCQGFEEFFRTSTLLKNSMKQKKNKKNSKTGTSMRQGCQKPPNSCQDNCYPSSFHSKWFSYSCLPFLGSNSINS